jgi:hypothetical protein
VTGVCCGPNKFLVKLMLMFCACTVPILLNLTTLAADPNALENMIFVSLRFESKSISAYVIYEVEMEAAPVGDGWG